MRSWPNSPAPRQYSPASPTLQLKAVMEALTPGNQPSGDDPYSPRPMPDLKFDAGMFFFVFLTAYVTAATIEEIMKAMAVRYSTGCTTGCTQVRKDTPHPRQLAYATTALLIAVSLGFSTVENLLYIFGASLSAGSTPSLSSVGAKCLLALVRGCISMPIHCLCVAFTALRLTLRDVQRDRVDLLQQAARGDGIFKWHAFALSGDVTGTSSTQRPEAADAGTFVTAFPATALRPSAEGEWVRVLNAASASTEAASIRVWGWPKVLWPAIAVHGTFDFQAMLLGALLYKDMSTASLTALTLVLGVTVQLVSLWILRQQYKGVFERIANNDLPGLTWKVHWVLCGTPPALPSLSNFGGTDNGGDDSFAPIPMSSGSVEAGGRAPWLDAREGERQPLTVPA